MQDKLWKFEDKNRLKNSKRIVDQNLLKVHI